MNAKRTTPDYLLVSYYRKNTKVQEYLLNGQRAKAIEIIYKATNNLKLAVNTIKAIEEGRYS